MITTVLCYSATSGSFVADCGKPCRLDMGNVGLSVCRSAVSEAEADFEALVSEYIGQMPFLWLNVSDGPGSSRGLVERNAIALLSGYSRPTTDGPSAEWLGQYSDRERVRLSGLWNNNHVDETYNPSFLDEMESWFNSNPQ